MGANQYTGQGKTRRLSVRIKGSDMARLEAALEGRKAADVVREAIVEWLERHAAKARILAVAGAGLLLGASCASNSNFHNLPASDRELFHRCWASMRRPICGDDDNLMYTTICVRDAEKTYGDKPASRRGRWLIAHGCPKDMVEAAQEDDYEEDDR